MRGEFDALGKGCVWLLVRHGAGVSTLGATSRLRASLGHDPAIFLRTYAHLYPGDLGAVADAMDAARSAVVDAQQEDDEGTPSVRAPNSVARVDFAGMARRRRQEAEH